MSAPITVTLADPVDGTFTAFSVIDVSWLNIVANVARSMPTVAKSVPLSMPSLNRHMTALSDTHNVPSNALPLLTLRARPLLSATPALKPTIVTLTAPEPGRFVCTMLLLLVPPNVTVVTIDDATIKTVNENPRSPPVPADTLPQRLLSDTHDVDTSRLPPSRWCTLYRDAPTFDDTSVTLVDPVLGAFVSRDTAMLA